ncbi:Olfactory Receptor 8S1 [Manis pentadactyla]|nr:Olfactory Receptor 8S1 [Manis pentadactyla]
MIQKREVTQEEVHEGVEAGISPDHQQQCQVPQQCLENAIQLQLNCLWFPLSRETSSRMALRNHSTISEFVLTGQYDHPHVQALLFVLFLGIYLLTLSGNLTLLLLLRADSRLHTPMYFFLSNLSFLDLCFSSVTVPKLLKDVLSEKKTYQWRAAWPRSSVCFSLQEMKPACSQ